MLNPTLAKEVIDYGLFKKADFVEIFVEEKHNLNLRYISQNLQDIKSGIDFGIGIRLLFGHNALYGFTNSSSKDDLLELITLLCFDKDQASTINSIELKKQNIKNIHRVKQPLIKSNSLEELINVIKKIDYAARGVDTKISQVDISTIEKFQKVEIFNSQGLHINDSRSYSRVMAQAIAVDGNSMETGYEAPGELKGREFFTQINPELIGEIIAKEAILKLSAIPSPAGEMPVILENGFGGVIFHEACGHLLETTSVAKKASIFHDKLNTQIASPVVTAIDDATIKNKWGSLNVDDEGNLCKKNILIENGVLKNFLSDRVGFLKTGHKMTGSGRRESYRFAPTSRMNNTYIDAGKDKFSDMISSIDNGIYAKKMGGGSVQPGTGEFNFAVAEGYLVKNGKITEPIKGATLIGQAKDILMKISMIAKNLEFAPGMCGSVSGSVPVTVGQPTLKVDSILVGGRK